MTKSFSLVVILTFTSLTLVNGLRNGMWQELPLSCKVCDSEESCNAATIKQEKCGLNSDTCVTVFGETQKVTNRGCYSKVYSQNCGVSNAKNKCYECRSNECNIAKSQTDYVQCYECSSFDNPNCIDPDSDPDSATDIPKKDCYKSCMKTLIFTSDEQQTNIEVIRSCLDDKEVKDQKRCDSLRKCEACNTPQCNTGVYPEDHLKCIHSEIESSISSKAQYCTSYKEDDKCMIEFNYKGVAIRYGCKSYLQENEVTDMLLDNKLYLCDGHECNTFKNASKFTSCASCSSKDERECITNLKVVVSTLCEDVPNTQCYTSYSESTGLLERGCWEDISSPNLKRKCLNGEGCTLCSTDGCNRMVVPADRASCLVCNSDADPNCHEKSSKKELCFNYDKNDKCVTKFIDGKTVRGCKTEIGSCNGLDQFSCRICSKGNCNEANLKSLVKDTGNKGMWQELPLTCKSCKNEEECKILSTTKKEKCNKDDECLTIFNPAGDKVIYRGCSSIIKESEEKRVQCDDNPDLCPQCKSNECNIANNVNEYVTCHYCGWPGTSACNDDIQNDISNSTRKCHKSCLIAAYKKGEDDEEVYNVVRTCLDDMESERQLKCQSNIHKECQVCDNNLCNSKILFDDWSKCYTCNNAKNCKKPKSQTCNSYAKNEGCYYLYGNSKEIVQAGCLSSLHKEQRLEFLKNNKISFCYGDGCNDKLPQNQKCLQCDSSKNEQCSVEPDKLKDSHKECSVPNSKCYVKLTSDGQNQRGCMSDLKKDILDCINSNTCKYCDGAECNNKLYPENRQKCFVCNSKEDKNCEEDPKNIKVCPTYGEDQKCVSKYTDGLTERHCSKELTCDPNDEKKCEICDDAYCNAKNLRKLNSSAAIVSNILLIGFAILIKGLM